MQDANVTVIIFGATTMVLVLLVVLFVLNRMLGKHQKQTQARLETFKNRFSDSQSTAARTASIRLNKEETGLGAKLSALLPRRDQVQLRLQKAGMDIELGRYAAICGAIAIGTATFLILAGFPAFMAFAGGIIAGIGLPHFYVGMRIKSRIERFTKQFPEAIDLMVRGLKSGLPVNECIANVGHELSAPTGTEFRKITDGMRLGKQLEDVLWETADRLDTPDFKFFVISLVVQRETGGNLGETLSNLSGILRQRQGMKLKIRAMSSEAKASAWIVGVLPFVMLGLIMLLNYDYGIILFTHPKAIVAGIGALIWMGIGMLVMGKMIQFEV